MKQGSGPLPKSRKGEASLTRSPTAVPDDDVPAIAPRELPDDGIDPKEASRWDTTHLGSSAVAPGLRRAGVVSDALRLTLERALRLSFPKALVTSDRFAGVRPRSSSVLQAEIPFERSILEPKIKTLATRPPAGVLARNDDVFAHWLAARVRSLGLSAGALGPHAAALTNVVFQPLQNAFRYGRVDEIDVPETDALPELYLNVVTLTGYQLRSYQTYRTELSKRGVHSSEFLEIIVADTGPGIARHYYLANRDPSSPHDLLDRDFAREWLMLTQAFERHNSSRHSYNQSIVDRGIHSPGIGLFSMLAGLKMMSAFFEVRTGRLRLFRYAFPDQKFDLAAPLLWPARVSPKLKVARGTIVRFLLPLHSDLVSGDA